MKYQRQNRQINNKMNHQKGFSLVEVLICIALLVLICVPLFATLELSADNSRRAHHTQMETEYAQEIMETLKSTELEVFTAEIEAAIDEAGNPSGEVKSKLDTAAKEKFAGYDDPTIYGDELFEVITCTQKNIRIGGKLYDMSIELNPVIYSDTDANAGDKAANVNTFAVVNINEIDGLKFPVISDEINSYEATEGANASAVLYNLLAQVRESQLSSLGENTNEHLLTIYENTVKTVNVKISDTGATETEVTIGGVTYIKNSIKVVCDVSYEMSYGGVSVKQVYNVYSGIFELKGEKTTTPSGENVKSWETGGDVYIFARAYNERVGVCAGHMLGANNIVIENTYSGTGDINVYLVAGRYSNGSGVHFNNVKVDGSTYCNSPSHTEILLGEGKYDNTRFHTNIKGMITSIAIASETEIATIGRDKPKLRCYEVLLTLTEQDTGKLVTHITSTKNM